MSTKETMWEDWWTDFLQRKKLVAKVDELNEFDTAMGKPFMTEKMCRVIYDNYDTHKERLKSVRDEIMQLLGELEEVHLQSSRIKQKGSLIEKVINKRYENIGSQTSSYAVINEDNYFDIITDLVGVRLIVNYRGKWQGIHKKILEHFPLLDKAEYERYEHIPHRQGQEFLAEIPKAYYAKGDNYQPYEDEGLEPKVHKMGYRSIHYIISAQDVYTELQVRTIYDEAWSDCDHNYVYKQGANPNSRALTMLSRILCDLTNAANDIGDNMHDIFQGQGVMTASEDYLLASSETIMFYKDILEKIQTVEEKLRAFNGLLRERN